MIERPKPELHRAGQRAGAGAGTLAGKPAHFGNPLLELREEQFVRHRDGKLQPLHGFRAFVSRFELRIHPFLAEETGAIFRDAVAAHEADGFAHHVRAVAGVPEFARGAKHIGQRVKDGKFHQRIGFQFIGAGQIAFADGLRIDFHQFHRLGLFLRHFLERGATRQIFIREPLVFLLFKRIQLVKQPRSVETQRRAGFAGCPHVHEAVQRVFLLLDAQFVTRRAGRAFAAAETAALIKNHRLDGGKQFRAGHQTDGHARAAEHGLDDFAVRKIRNDHAVLDRVAADDAAGGNFQIEHRIVRRGKLVDEFFRRRATIPNSRIAFFQE